MKIMTYNILGEDGSRISLVLEAIKSEAPDFLAIQEANFFTENDNKYLKEFSKELKLPYYEISLGGEDTYHVASFFKHPFKKVNKLKGFRNAALETVIESELGEVSICNTHLSPWNEKHRLKEVKKIIKQQSKYKYRIILGDLNSLSYEDRFYHHTLKLRGTQIRKFTTDGELKYLVIPEIYDAGYFDLAVFKGINYENTVPTPVNKDKDHGYMRLDYIFGSEGVAKTVKNVEVLKNKLTNKASDHYPVIVLLN